ncbi:PREDICTED: nitric oxide synthase-interacting protein [Myotis davidii]|uniref:nitric oxide synthase-interacting protein n=1 Tax=Myotis davidii TaxID=225400 RepID=UPI0003EC0DCC|nr:PREDICTED: nitric oxide synthase-interacting protein [Myotis davidii]
MTRHGKNCTAGAVYTYHEKKKDTAASGYGTQNIRLSRDAVKDFDCCCLSLQPCHDPVVTPDGYLYEREAILEYILHQKKEIARQLKAYEKQRGARREERKELQRAAAQDQVRGFLEKEAAIVSRPLNPFTPKAASGTGPDDTGATMTLSWFSRCPHHLGLLLSLTHRALSCHRAFAPAVAAA